MTIFITGGSKSGKSMLAQRLARELAGGEPLYYIATMEPKDGEDLRRIARHVEDRKDWGFETLECPRNVSDCLERAEKSGVFLLDSITALLSNEMFTKGGVCLTAAEKIAQELEMLAGSVGGLVVVADNIFCDGEEYGELTEEFRKGLAHISRRLALLSDRVIEVCAGRETDLKKECETGDCKAAQAVIFGGSYQGKTEYAVGLYGLGKEDICVCGREEEPDFSKRCLCCGENLARRCMDSGVSAEKLLEKWFDAHDDGIIIFDDIFCGVVPIDGELRAWREETGRLLSFAAKKADSVTRIICGLPQKLK